MRGDPVAVVPRGDCTMGHRALVAYERTDGQYTLHYSHWGAANLKLKHRISAESPFGGDDTDSKWAKQLLAELADGLEADAVDGYLAGEDRPSTVVEPKPRATGLTLDEIVADHLDYLHHEDGPTVFLYSEYANGIRHREQLDRVLEASEELWIVPADVHF